MIYPWQQEQWQTFWHTKQVNRLPHALLLTGIPGMGKVQFADTISRTLLCQQVTKEGRYCGTCHMCCLTQGRAHPNVLWIEPEKEGQAIKVDQIREVNEFVNQSSLQGEYRMVIIHPADNMNLNAANALLKTLEEPSKGSLILLVCHQSARLPATVLSRCQKIVFPKPKKEEALRWLQTQSLNQQDPLLLLNLANGAPLAALRLAEDESFSIRQDLFDALYDLAQMQGDPLQFAAKLQEKDTIRILDFCLSWIMDLVRLQLEDFPEKMINADYAKQLIELKTKTQLKNNMKWLEQLQRVRGQICEGINLNKQMVIENIFIQWSGR